MAIFRRKREEVVVEPSPPRVMAREEVAQRLSGAGPAVVASIVPAIRYATRREPDAALDLGESKFGGAPDLPHGVGWPMMTPADGERRPLQFFAQLDLAEAAAAALSPLALPAGGCLSFFADFDPIERPGSAPQSPVIMHSPFDTPLTRCGLRLVPLLTAQVAPIGMWSWRAAPEDGALRQEYEIELRERLPERYHLTGRHQLGGHSPVGDQLEEGEVVVFHFDSDDTLEIEWEGGLAWVMRSADIARDDWTASRLIRLPG